MALKDGLIPEFDAELASTRRVLERIPMDKASWKPHAKSFALGDLATHVVQMHTWVGETLRKDKIDMIGYARPTVPSTTAELLARFDEYAKDAREALAAATDEQMLGNWSLTAGEQVYFTMPRIACLRTFVFNHVVHHRGQLTVYLRLLDVPVPGLYGPSADDKTAG